MKCKQVEGKMASFTAVKYFITRRSGRIATRAAICIHCVRAHPANSRKLRAGCRGTTRCGDVVDDAAAALVETAVAAFQLWNARGRFTLVEFSSLNCAFRFTRQDRRKGKREAG